MDIRYDEFGIPVNVEGIPRAVLDFTDNEREGLNSNPTYTRLSRILDREPTRTELSAGESMESEHASYASTRLHLKSILPTNGPNHIKGLGAEAASAAFFVKNGRTIALSYSSESHNGPSYVCAHPGAATGTGGNQRDNISADGMKPESLYEARRQGHPEFNHKGDPIKQHTDETTRGIGDYGNAMGIPHGDGSMKYHPGFTGNNLVNVMAVSVAHRERLLHNKVEVSDPENYFAIYIGKASDKTGIGGTKFASQAIDMTNTDLNEKAVQDPDPHLQEAVTRGIEILVDKAIREGWKGRLFLKDMGAAGLLCSTIEQLPKGVGMVINGDLVPQNELRDSTELLEAETQERFMVIAHRDHVQDVLGVFNEKLGMPHINKGACAKVIGRCDLSGRYVFVRNGTVDVDVPSHELAAGPAIIRPFHKPERQTQELPPHMPLEEAMERVLDSINFKSDAYIHDHYDKHVRSTNIVNRGEGCATLRTHELFEGEAGYSVSFDSNPVIGYIDPALQAADSFVRGAYKMAVVGCSVVGVTNNANYGRTNVPEEFYAFVQGQYGVREACWGWELEDEYMDMIMQDPEIAKKFAEDDRRHLTVNSGNCSMNKANANTGTAIPPTTILGLVGWTNAPSQYATWDLKPETSTLYLVGARQSVLGATDYLQACFGPDTIGNEAYKINYSASRREVNAIIKAVRRGLVSAANVIEEGGLFNAVSEMMANTRVGVDVSLNLGSEMSRAMLDAYQKLFSESPGMVLQIPVGKSAEFESLCRSLGADTYAIGGTNPGTNYLNILHNDSVYRIDGREASRVYHTKLQTKLGGAAV